jgi:hypothetical protein
MSDLDFINELIADQELSCIMINTDHPDFEGSDAQRLFALDQQRLARLEKLKLQIESVDRLKTCAERLNNGRDYLMQANPSSLTIEDVFQAFGFGSNGERQ